MHTLALEHVTVLGLSPPEIVSTASEAGYDAVSIILPPSPYLGDRIQPLVGNGPLVKETAQRMKAAGVSLSLGEGFVIDQGVAVDAFREPLDIARELGARCINCTILDPDRTRALDMLAQLTELAAESGAETVIEFSAFSPVATSLPAAVAILEEVDNDHLGLLVDIMHVVRCGNQVSDLASVDPATIKYAQICDGPLFSPSREAYMEEALHDRAIPGEGEMGARDFLALVPDHVIMGVETPSRTLENRGMSFVERARYAREATLALAS